MPDYNLGRAHGEVQIDYDDKGIKAAKKDVDDLADTTANAGSKIADSVKLSEQEYKTLSDSIKQLQGDVNRYASSAQSAQARLAAAEQQLASAREKGQAAADRIGNSEKELASARQYAKTAANAEKDAMAALKAAKQNESTTTDQLKAAELNLSSARNESKAAVESVRGSLAALNSEKERSAASATKLANAEKAFQAATARSEASSNKLKAGLSALNSQKAKLGQQKVNIDVDDKGSVSRIVGQLGQLNKTTNSGLSGLNSFTGRTGALAASLALASPQAAGLAVSLVNMVGAAGVAAGALAALAAVGATLFAGLGGLKDAFKAQGKAAAGGGASAASAAKQQKAAADQIRNAKESLASAEENLRRTVEDNARAAIQASRQVVDAENQLKKAQTSAIKAQKDLQSAREDAARQLVDYSQALKGGALDEEQAVLNVQKAKEDLANTNIDPRSTDTDRKQAILTLKQEQLALENLQIANQRLGKDSSDAAAKGVAGSDQVVAAQENVADAAQAIKDAQQGVADAIDNQAYAQVQAQRAIVDATKQISDAQRALADAYANAGESGASGGSKVDDAMSKISPKARELVKAIMALAPAWQDVKFATQDALLNNMVPAVQAVASKYLPLLRAGMVGVATELNGLAMRVKDFLLEAQTTKDVATIFDNTSLSVERLGPALTAILQIIRDVATVGTSFLPQLAGGFSDAATKAAEFVANARETGKLGQWMQTGVEMVKQLWEVLKNLGSIIVSVFTAFDQQGGGTLALLANLTGKLAAFLKTAEGQSALEAIGKTLAVIGGSVGTVFLALLQAIAPILVSLAPLFQEIAKVIAGELVTGIKVLAPILQVVGDVLGFLSPILGPLIASFLVFSKLMPVLAAGIRIVNLALMVNPFIAIAAAVIALVVIIVTNWDAIKAALLAAWEWIKSTAETVWTAISDFFVGIWNGIKTFFEDIWNGIVDWFNAAMAEYQAAWELVWTTISDFFSGIWNGIKTFFTDIWNSIVDWFVGKIYDFKATWIQVWQDVKDFFSKAWEAIKTAGSNAIQAVGKFFSDLPGNIGRALSGIGSWLLQAGQDLVQGLIRGIGNAAGWLWDKLVGIVKSAWNGVLSFLGINSPAREGIWAMEMLGKGLVIGLSKSENKVAAAAQALIDAASVAVDGSVTMAIGADAVANATVPVGSPAATMAAVSAAGTPGATGINPNTPAGQMVTIQNLVIQVAGNLDPTDPTAWRAAMVNIKDGIRNVERQYQ